MADGEKVISSSSGFGENKQFFIEETDMNESTARTFRKRYESDLPDAKRQGKTLSTSLPLKPQGRTFALGGIDEMVQCYILVASNRGSVIT